MRLSGSRFVDLVHSGDTAVDNRHLAAPRAAPDPEVARLALQRAYPLITDDPFASLLNQLSEVEETPAPTAYR
jgi:hypothetical protein